MSPLNFVIGVATGGDLEERLRRFGGIWDPRDNETRMKREREREEQRCCCLGRPLTGRRSRSRIASWWSGKVFERKLESCLWLADVVVERRFIRVDRGEVVSY